MTDEAEQSPTQENYDIPSVDEYNRFIQQLQLDSIWLRSSRVTNSLGSDIPISAVVNIEDTAEWKDSETGFQAFHKYAAEFRNDKGKRIGKIEIVYGLDFESDEAMTDELFILFGEHNLPLNTWPYFREYLASTVTRMGWTPLTLPVRKLSGPVASSLNHLGEEER